MLGMNHLIGDP